MFLRAAVIASLACAAALAAGCGGDGGADDPLDAALGYLPAETPFAAAFETDLDGDQFAALSERSEELAGGNVRDLLEAAIGESDTGLSLEQDIEPALGNPVVIGATNVETFLDDTSEDAFVAAIQAADSEALERIVEESGAEETGEVAGATVYDGDFAIDGDVVVLAGDEELLTQALETQDAGDGLDPDTFTGSFEDLPEDAIADVFFNVGVLIDNDPDTEQAEQVPWVGALTTFGMTLSATEEELTAEFRLGSDGEELEEEDVPLATGDDSPAVIPQPGAIAAGLRDPAHIARFFESTYALLEPEEYETFDAAKPVIADQFGIDIEDDLYDQLTGDVAATISLDGSFTARAELADADAFTETVDALAEALPAFSDGQIGQVRRAGELYVTRMPDGTPIAFGVIDEAFVVAPTPREAMRIAETEPDAVEGAEGSLVAKANAGEIAAEALSLFSGELGLPPGVPMAFFEQFGDLELSIASETDAMRGRLSLDLG